LEQIVKKKIKCIEYRDKLNIVPKEYQNDDLPLTAD